MAADQQLLVEFIGRIVEETGLSATEIARRADLAPSTVTRIFPKPQVGYGLSARSIAKIERAFPAIGPFRSDDAPGHATTLAERGHDTMVRDKRDRYAPPPPPSPSRDVPLFAAALVGGLRSASWKDESGTEWADGPVVEQFRVRMEQPLRTVLRPPNLSGRVAALYVVGSVMEPRLRSGEVVFFHQDRPPRIGDEVLVILADGDEAGGKEPYALLRTLVRQTADDAIFSQYLPALQIRLPAHMIEAIYPVVPLADLYV